MLENSQLNYKEVLDVLAARRSIREFDDQPLDRSIVDEIINDGCEAPSACNHQMWHFVLVDDSKTKAQLQHYSGSNHHFVTCSTIVILCFHKGWNHNKFAVVQSTAAAAYHMSISAHLRGLGATWNAGIGNKDKVSTLLQIPPQFEVIGALCLGWPKADAPAIKPPRRPLDSVRSWGTFLRPKDEIYPLKNSASYPYFKLLNHKNKFSVFSPRVWGWDRIGNFRGLAVFAKSPLPGTYVSRRFGTEMQKEVDLIPFSESKSIILELMPYGGSYTALVMKKFGAAVKLHITELSDMNNKFVKERLKQEGLVNQISASVMKDGLLPYETNMFDVVFLPQILEGVPDQEKLLKEVKRVLKPEGYAVITCRNKLSWFGVYFKKNEMKGQVPNFGPYLPLNPYKLRGMIKMNFNIQHEVGISPTPLTPGKVIKGWRSRHCRLYGVVANKQTEMELN